MFKLPGALSKDCCFGEDACFERGALGFPGTSSHQAPPSHMATTETGEMEFGLRFAPLSATSHGIGGSRQSPSSPKIRALVRGLDGRQEDHLYPHISDGKTEAHGGKGPFQGYRVSTQARLCSQYDQLESRGVSACGPRTSWEGQGGGAGAWGSPGLAQCGGRGAGPRCSRSKGPWWSALAPTSLVLPGCQAVWGLPPPPSSEQAHDSPGTQSCTGHGRGLALGKGAHRSGLSVPRSPW